MCKHKYAFMDINIQKMAMQFRCHKSRDQIMCKYLTSFELLNACSKAYLP